MSATIPTAAGQPPTQQEDPTILITSEEERISAAMANDRPTIDSAVKAFLSLICARSMTSSMTDHHQQDRKSSSSSSSSRVLLGVIPSTTSGSSSSPSSCNPITSPPPAQQQLNQQALEVARLILQTCNKHEFPIHKTVAHERLHKPGLTPEEKEKYMELSVVARLWNGLIQSKQKPTRFLGRKALLHAWSDLDISSKIPSSEDPNDTTTAAQATHTQQMAWLQEFEDYLQYDSKKMLSGTEVVVGEVDNDAALIWDADGGQSELARRRERRKVAATERGPTII